MKLRNKILIAISLVWLVFIILIYAGARGFLLNSFLKIEAERINRDLTRLDHALQVQVNTLYSFTYDWSHWNDIYNYLTGQNPGFVANNLTMIAFLNSKINFISYWNYDGKLIVGSAVDLQNKKFVPFPVDITKYIYPGSEILNYQTPKDIKGYMLIGHDLMMVAQSRIQDGKNIHPPIGIAIMGRIFGSNELDHLINSTQLSVKLFKMNAHDNNAEIQDTFSKMVNTDQKHLIDRTDQNTVHAYSLIKDIDNKPIALIRLTATRSIYLTGFYAIHYFIISFIILGIIFALLMTWLLRILVISRVERLDEKVTAIHENEAIAERVPVTGNDELTSLSAEINSMLEKIQVSQEKLKHRVQRRTEQLEETNTKLKQQITQRKSIENELVANKEHLKRIVHYDTLTNLPNRVFFNELLNTILTEAKQTETFFSLLFIDIDRFKNINDALGHGAGDRVIQETARRFKELLTDENDLLARLGGDEFIVLLRSEKDPEGVNNFAEKLISACAIPIKIDGTELFVTVSIGICLYPTDGKSLEDLQKNADTALYRAKRSGGNVFSYFTKEMNMQAHEKIKLEASLRKAIINNEFVLYYQPKLNLKDWSIEGVEALIRWESPELGMVSPIKFIPLAEETGVILQIGEWALREACKANKRWQKQGYEPITMAVNLSFVQFRHKNIAKMVKDILDETDLEAQYLELEITESAVMENVEAAIEKLNEIRKMGISIAIDDFGTGYTSINYLKQLPATTLKIDQSFVKGIPKNRDDLAIISAVISMAHNLNIKVVAEGVETAEQLQALIEQHCDLVQGYFFSRPLSERKIISQFTRMGQK